MALVMEEYIPGIRENGLNTNEAATLGSTLAVTGTSTFTGTETFNGAATFNSTVTFATTPTYTAGRLTAVIQAAVPTVLTQSQATSQIVFNSTTGVVVTLPAPVVGTVFEFVVGQTPVAGTHGIATTASVFISGQLVIAPANGTVATYTANGTSNSRIGMNGTTTGGILGSNFRAICTSATVWTVTGVLGGSGALATPIV